MGILIVPVGIISVSVGILIVGILNIGIGLHMIAQLRVWQEQEHIHLDGGGGGGDDDGGGGRDSFDLINVYFAPGISFWYTSVMYN